MAMISFALMTGQEVQEHLQTLGLTQAEAAQLLGVSTRTLSRWCTGGEAVPGPAEAALRAWRRLDKRVLAWRPDSVSIVEDNVERMAIHRQEAIRLDDILHRVESRGGPSVPWAVSLPGCEAKLGQVYVSFYKLRNGGFSPSVYSRRDGVAPDIKRDWPLIEDAIFCIAQEFEKHASRSVALRAVAAATRSKSHVFGERGPRMLNPAQRVERQRSIEAQADRIDELANRADDGRPTSYREFNEVLATLSGLGYSPPAPALISAVPRAYVDRRARVRILFVREGAHEAPVTKAIETDEVSVRRIVAGRALKYLGPRLPIIGESSPLTSFTGPAHVVVEIPAGADVAGAERSGLYLIKDLTPEQVERAQY